MCQYCEKNKSIIMASIIGGLVVATGTIAFLTIRHKMKRENADEIMEEVLESEVEDY